MKRRKQRAIRCRGGLQDFAKARGLVAADALLVRLGEKKVLDEGNDAFGDSRQKPVFVCSAGGSSDAVLPQDYSRRAQEPRCLGWFVGFRQNANLISHIWSHKQV